MVPRDATRRPPAASNPPARTPSVGPLSGVRPLTSTAHGSNCTRAFLHYPHKNRRRAAPTTTPRAAANRWSWNVGGSGVFFQRFPAEGAAQLGSPTNISRSPEIFSWLPRVVFPNGDASRVYVLWQEIIFSGGTHGGEKRARSGCTGGAFPVRDRHFGRRPAPRPNSRPMTKPPRPDGLCEASEPLPPPESQKPKGGRPAFPTARSLSKRSSSKASLYASRRGGRRAFRDAERP